MKTHQATAIGNKKFHQVWWRTPAVANMELHQATATENHQEQSLRASCFHAGHENQPAKTDHVNMRTMKTTVRKRTTKQYYGMPRGHHDSRPVVSEVKETCSCTAAGLSDLAAAALRFVSRLGERGPRCWLDAACLVGDGHRLRLSPGRGESLFSSVTGARLRAGLSTAIGGRARSSRQPRGTTRRTRRAFFC